MKMKVKRAIALLIAVLAITTLTGCPPTMLPTEKISAKEAWDIMKSAQETLPNDAVPVYIWGVEGSENPIEEGKAGIWDIGFYSESEGIIWNVHLYNEADSKENILGDAEERYTDISLTAYDLADWNVDSTEAYEIATQHGAGDAVSMSLRSARFNLQKNEIYSFEIYSFIPETIKLLWVIRAGDLYCIDACTGEFLGSYTTEQLRNMGY